jgi:REP-associated tyrosine transposase
MPRTPRLTNNEQATVYHVMSRTALDGFPIKDVEKDFLLKLIKRYAALYLVEILGFCLMDNHFHLLVRMLPEDRFTDDDIKKRFASFYGDTREITDGQIPTLKAKLASLSEFTREIKVNFARYYNRRNNRRGYFWGDRFKSVIVENGETLINCLAYIDLNPVRAKLVERPDDYRWNSIGYHVQTNNKDNFLSFDFGLEEFGVKSKAERIRRYRLYVYEAGAIESSTHGSAGCIDEKVLAKERGKDFATDRIDRFRSRTRYFSDAGIIGTREFVQQNFQRFKTLFQSKHDKIPKPIKGLDGIYSLRRLNTIN